MPPGSVLMLRILTWDSEATWLWSTPVIESSWSVR